MTTVSGRRLAGALVVYLVATGAVGPIKAQAQTLSASQFADSPNAVNVAIFLDGNVKKLFAQDTGGQTAAGTIGIRRWTNKTYISAQISVAAAADTVRSRYGASILTPFTGSALNSGIITVSVSNSALGFLPSSKMGLKSYASVSTMLWSGALPSATDSTVMVTQSYDVPIVGLGLGIVYEAAKGTLASGSDSKNVGMTLNAGGTFRGVFGDLASSRRDTEKLAFLGTTDEFFWGLEVGMELSYGQITSGITFYRIFDADVDGLSDGQVAAGVSIAADLITGVLRD